MLILIVQVYFGKWFWILLPKQKYRPPGEGNEEQDMQKRFLVKHVKVEFSENYLVI